MNNTITTGQRVMIIAGLAGADHRTVRRFLAGQPVRGDVLRERIEEALRQVDQAHMAMVPTPPRASATAPMPTTSATTTAPTNATMAVEHVFLIRASDPM
jgi:hypothetical protein